MSNIDVAVVAQSVASMRGTGANAYRYSAASGSNLELQEKVETIPAGGNRVVAAVELEGPATEFPTNALALLAELDRGARHETQLKSGSLHLHLALPGGATAPSGAVDAAIRALRGLLDPSTRAKPLDVERTHRDAQFHYRLTDDSWKRVAAKFAPSYRPTWSVGEHTKDAFEQTYGPFEQTLLLGSLAGLDEASLMELGGYRVLESGHVVYYWAWSPG